MSQVLALVVVVVAALLSLAAGAAVARRRGYLREGDVIVRCSRGHLFETSWLPPFSFRMLHLGWARLQRCPVEGHLSLVRRADVSRLSSDEKKTARRVHDEFWGARSPRGGQGKPK